MGTELASNRWFGNAGAAISSALSKAVIPDIYLAGVDCLCIQSTNGGTGTQIHSIRHSSQSPLSSRDLLASLPKMMRASLADIPTCWRVGLENSQARLEAAVLWLICARSRCSVHGRPNSRRHCLYEGSKDTAIILSSIKSGT
jgi:hypothetical protein